MSKHQPTEYPNAEQPLLIGLLIDVSGSMQSAINNNTGKSLNRLESFKDSFDNLIMQAKKLSQEGQTGKIAPRVKLFAYGFGFGGLGSVILDWFSSSNKRSEDVRDLLDISGEPSSTVSIDRLAANWSTYQRHIEGMAYEMFGSTPMGDAFLKAKERIQLEKKKQKYIGNPILFVLSDGSPTDYSPEHLASEIKDQGTIIISCYVTDKDFTEPRHLYGTPPANWPSEARLMFNCASILPKGSPFEKYMNEHRWNIEENARLFTQINQSEILSEFLNVIISPLREQQGERNNKMHPNRLNQQRLVHLEELLEIEYDKLYEFQKAIAMEVGAAKIALKQQLKRDVVPAIRNHEVEYAKLLSEDLNTMPMPEAEAEQAVGLIKQAVEGVNEKIKSEPRPEELIHLLKDIQEKLQEPGKTASAKLKVSLPVIPLIAAYEMEMDTESLLINVWRRIKSLFKSNT